MKTLTLSIVVLLFFGALSFTSCGSQATVRTSDTLQVKTALAKRDMGKASQDFAFISKPYRTSELSFRISGPTLTFNVFSGNYYRQGQMIAQIDPRDFLIRRNRAQALYQQAQAEAQRIEALYNKENISASAYEKSQAEYTTAKMAYQTSLNELSDTELLAPFDGYVGQVYIEQYQDVRAAQPVVSLVDISRLKIEAYVPQNIALMAKKNQMVELRFDAHPEQTYSATIEEISKNTTANNLSYLLTAILPNPKSELLSGMSGHIIFDNTTQPQPTQVTIPQTALCHRPTIGDYVWMVDSTTQTVRQQKIEVLAMQGNDVVVGQGLQTGDIVATTSLRFLADGQTIQIAR